MSIRFLLPAAALLCPLMGSCAASGPYPSLLPRPEELDRNKTAPQASVAPPTPADPALASRIEQLLANARGGETTFRAELPRTESLVAAAGAPGSDRWIEAQQALSRLEAARSSTTVAASELDALARTRVEANPAGVGADAASIAAAIDQVHRLTEGQDQAIARLAAALPTP